ADRLDRVVGRRRRRAVLLEKPAGLALVLEGREQEELGGDELVAALGRFLVGEVEEVVEVPGDGDLASLPLDLGKPADGVLERLLEGARIHPRALEERRRAALLLVEQRQEQ